MKNPIIAALINAALSVVTTVVSKKKMQPATKNEAPNENSEEAANVINSVAENIPDIKGSLIKSIDEVKEVSLTRIQNATGTPIIFGFAIKDMSENGINSKNIAILCIGVIYSVTLGLITHFKEKANGDGEKSI